jgi:hypothetical protein
MFAEKTLCEWKLLMPLDVGRIVYALVEEGVVHAQSGDSFEQFDIDMPLNDARWGQGQNPHHSQMSRPDPVARQSWIERQANAIELCILISAFLFLIFAGHQGLLMWSTWWIWPLAALGAILLAISIRRSLRNSRLQRTLTEQNYLLCPECEYSLKGLPTKGECPECGHPYIQGPLQRAWLRLQQSPPRNFIHRLMGVK